MKPLNIAAVVLLLVSCAGAPKDELGCWLENMVLHHGYRPDEVAAATGMSAAEVDAALANYGLKGKGVLKDAGAKAAKEGRILVLPYPGGRHPRIGFLEGAIDPWRETKVSVFLPWEGAGYVVVDNPEAIWARPNLIFLAHKHIPTLWDSRGLKVPHEDWKIGANGALTNSFKLPDGVEIDSRVVPGKDCVDLYLTLKNGSAQKVTGIKAQICIMLKAAEGFNGQTNDNKKDVEGVSTCRSGDGKRWIVTVWEAGKPWANPPVPCMHSDPEFDDIEPGAECTRRGRIFFWEGEDVEGEIERRKKDGTLLPK